MDQVVLTIINQYDFNLRYARELVVDLSEEQMSCVPAKGLVNHPAFTLGHLISGSALLVEDLGGEFDMKEQWSELFLRNGPGDPRLPDSDRRKFPSKEELLQELTRQHNKVKNMLENLTEDKLKESVKWRFSEFMPTTSDLIMFMCINHEAMHLGQLAAWRRAMDLPSALGSL